MPPGVVHQDVAHGPRGDAIEVGPVVNLEPGLVGQTDERLVDQCGWLESLARRFLGHFVSRQLVTGRFKTSQSGLNQNRPL